MTFCPAAMIGSWKKGRAFLRALSHAGPETSWAGYNHATGNYSTRVDLAPGQALTSTWDALPDAWYWKGSNRPPAHSCPSYKDTRNNPGHGLVLEPYINSKAARSYGNGLLNFTPDFSSDAVRQSFVALDNVKFADGALVPAEAGQPASAVFRLASPYIMTRAGGTAAGADTFEISTDEGKSYRAVDVKDFSEAVKGQLGVVAKVTFKQPLTDLKTAVVVQNNPCVLPYLSPGKNTVAVSVGDSAALGDNRLVVTYAYRLGSRNKSMEQLCAEGKEVAKQHNAKWSDTVTVVRKTFAAKDLPASFEIDCPTPKGQYPVYPRMLFVRREVVGPGGTPTPLPEGSVAAAPAATDELATLPNPFLVGTEPPPVVKVRPVRTVQIPLTYLEYVDEKGEAAAKGTLRWPKNAGEAGKVLAGAVLIGGELHGLPGPKELAAVRLCVPVTQTHDKAAGQLGAVILSKPIDKGKPMDVNGLSDVEGMVVLPAQPADVPQYRPAKIFTIDLTRSLKAVAAGEAKFRGVALRMVPNRGVDDGWTVRCEISPTDKIYLEADVYQD